MADLIAFPCIRPRADIVQEVAALPYDVYNLEEARAEIKKHPHSFLRIDIAETNFSRSVPINDSCIYDEARRLLDLAIADGTYIIDEEPRYYLYRLTTKEGREQTGVVGCASIDDYLSDVIKKHENTNPFKEIDRIRHIDTCSAHTGLIFLAFRSDGSLESVMNKVTAEQPLYDFTTDDGVCHTIWRVNTAQDCAFIRQVFESTPALYIADGHHRTKSAVEAGLLRRKAAQAAGQAEGEASLRPSLPSDHFLSIAFPSDQLVVLDYNRVVADLNGLSRGEFFERIRECFIIAEPQYNPVRPAEKGVFGMYLDGMWHKLTIKDEYRSSDPVAGLDASLLQDRLLAPILGIDDPRTNDRIDFIGGIRGLNELKRRVDKDMTVAFALCPTSLEELFTVADKGKLMPPKSTWFEPKPRSGIFIHRI
ncbi:MAG: DUF1015 family protein [Eggerthellaceae bacterium]|nr:DUF1015 family protein [Eggerthellaceae bacterium]